MPRQKREDFAGARHHVMNCGVGRGAIFFNDAYCGQFLEILGAVVERFNIRVCAYVLMTNHYHLLVESVHGNLSAAMKMLSQAYTQFVNQAPGWEGPVFRGRFKSKRIQDDAHWRYLPIYMHLNPVRARMASHPGQYAWCSHDVYCGNADSPKWLETGNLLEGYGGDAGYRQMLEAVMQGREMAPEAIEYVLFGRIGPQKRRKRRVVKSKPFRTARGAMAEVAELTGVAVKDLKIEVRGRTGNPARTLAMWWLVYGAGLGTAEAGRKLGLAPSAATQSLSGWKPGKGRYRSGELWKWRKELESKKYE